MLQLWIAVRNKVSGYIVEEHVKEKQDLKNLFFYELEKNQI